LQKIIAHELHAGPRKKDTKITVEDAPSIEEDSYINTGGDYVNGTVEEDTDDVDYNEQNIDGNDEDSNNSNYDNFEYSNNNDSNDNNVDVGANNDSEDSTEQDSSESVINNATAEETRQALQHHRGLMYERLKNSIMAAAQGEIDDFNKYSGFESASQIHVFEDDGESTDVAQDLEILGVKSF